MQCTKINKILRRTTADRTFSNLPGPGKPLKALPGVIGLTQSSDCLGTVWSETRTWKFCTRRGGYSPLTRAVDWFLLNPNVYLQRNRLIYRYEDQDVLPQMTKAYSLEKQPLHQGRGPLVPPQRMQFCPLGRVKNPKNWMLVWNLRTTIDYLFGRWHFQRGKGWVTSRDDKNLPVSVRGYAYNRKQLCPFDRVEG